MTKKHLGVSLDAISYAWVYRQSLANSCSMSAILRQAVKAAMKADLSRREVEHA